MNFANVQHCAPKDWLQISALFEKWPFKTLNGSGSDSLDLFALTARRVIRTLESDKGAAWMMLQRNQTLGFSSLTLLPWDSQQLGFAAARIDYLVAEGPYPQQHSTKKALLAHVVNEALRRGIWHLSMRVDSNDLSSLHVLEEAGFITVDSILTFSINLDQFVSETTNHQFEIRQATTEDTERSATLAQKIYTLDRFHSDPLINKDKADQLHATWIRNSVAGIAADAVFVAEENNELIGFVTCKIQPDSPDRGTIVLVGCREEARGKGLGEALTVAALNWFQTRGCKVVEVGTQLRNMPASRLYQKCGFQLAGSSISLRLVL